MSSSDETGSIMGESLTETEAHAFLKEHARWIPPAGVARLLNDALKKGFSKVEDRVLISFHGGKFWISVKKKGKGK